MKTFVTRQYESEIKGDRYEVHRFFIPTGLGHRVGFLKKYFKVVDRQPLQKVYRRRKNKVEWAETAIMALGRIDMMCSLKIPVVLGSRFISPVPWAIFGEKELFARNTFQNVSELACHYEDEIMECGARAEYAHFRLYPGLSQMLAKKWECTPHLMMAVAIAFLYDLLTQCGPDSPEFFDVFTNDFRDSPDKINIRQWEEMRCKVMGRGGKLEDEPHNISLGQVHRPRIPLVSVTNLEEVFCSDNLAQGEKVLPLVRVPSKEPESEDLQEDHSLDDGTTVESQIIRKDPTAAARLEKYAHLGLGRHHMGWPGGSPNML